MKRWAAIAACWAVMPLADARGADVRLSAPRSACLISPVGQLHTLFGVPGGYVLGEPVRSEVLSVACGDGFTLVKTTQALEWLDAEGQLAQSWPAPGGPARFGLAADGARAVVYLPESGQWFLAAEGGLCPLPVGLGGRDEEVLSVALLSGDSIGAAVRRSGRYWFARVGLDSTIREEYELAEALAPILVLTHGAIAWGAGEGFMLQQQAGVRRYVPLPAPPAELTAAGEREISVQLTDGRGRLLVRLSKAGEDLYRLPEVPP